MLERRMLILVAALVVFLASAALWNAFVRRPARASAGATPGTRVFSPNDRRQLPAELPRRRAERLPALAGRRRARAVQPGGGLRLRRSAGPMAHPVRGRALGADGPAVGRRRTRDRWRRHPLHLRC